MPLSMCGWKVSVDDVLQRHGTPSQTGPASTPEAIEDQQSSGGPSEKYQCIGGRGRLGHRSPDKRKQSPRVRDALEVVFTPILKVETRSSHQVGNRPRDQDLSRSRGSSDSCTDMDSDSSEVLSSDFDFSGVKTDPYLDSHFASSGPDRISALDGTTRPVESDEEAVASGLDLSSPEIWPTPHEPSCYGGRGVLSMLDHPLHQPVGWNRRCP